MQLSVAFAGGEADADGLSLGHFGVADFPHATDGHRVDKILALTVYYD